MPKEIKLADLINQIQETVEDRFAGESFWITSEITDVNKWQGIRCYLKFIERSQDGKMISIKGVCWERNFHFIEKLETITGNPFVNGIKITCKVAVSFFRRDGITQLEILEIDFAHTIGQLEIEKKQTLERLIKENPKTIRLIDGQYQTFNNSLEFPIVIQKIALITAPNSDGQRDFKQEIEKNKHRFAFSIKEYLTQIQGGNSSKLILQQLKYIEEARESFDVVAIVRGGGSQTDFKPFDDYDLSKCVATFPIPILTGIGHDSNISIVDLMARQHKTPTKVATYIVEHNLNFESSMEDLKERFFQAVEELLENAKDELQEIKRIVKSSSPTTILKKGFAIITSNDKIITDPKSIKPNSNLQTLLQNEIIHSTVTKKTKNEKRFDV